ncbi:DUF968 domain-containing protein [Frederiksenia canicola]|uniref:Uncharacterized protein DUF968 n=1 Tax=Frederiksenia canicola TaxID=123824 RepID=A0AAE6X7D3_9PAST|nr:DUF968 domain-containing protein [Frederiksenia canicola]QIM65244.1 hypothetical protein A4G17_07240 [Frederiksenia canicola]RPE96328.1 uncharacterized protein DUF968 [Frederiksenia canicola]
MNETLLLTPYFQTEVGIVFYRIPPNVAPSAFGERTLLQPAPTALQTEKSGKIAKCSAEVTACNAVAELAKSSRVRQAVNHRTKPYGDLPYTAYVKQIQTCQCRDGKYCHPEKVLAETQNGLVQLCWHHDRERMEGNIKTEQLEQLAEQNWQAFIAETIRRQLRKSKTAPIEFADVVLWACLNGLMNELNSEEVRQFLGYEKQIDLTKESSIGFENPDSLATLHKVSAALKLKVDPEPPASFMARPKLKRFENRKWLQFVKSQPCVCCGARADDPHHIIGNGGGKMGGKEHDLFTIPLCRIHHDELHRNVGRFEQQYGSQLALLYKFLDRAIGLGALVIDD